ncbi:hypothetical protein [Streptomyces sp. NPDC048603]|uniref:hypothetical protein n=1 Tax=Streptomyces sp. NPDC048603 TaxID=3365577 RepID=UPI003710DDD9
MERHAVIGALRLLLVIVAGLALGAALLAFQRHAGRQAGWVAFLAVETALVLTVLLRRQQR